MRAVIRRLLFLSGHPSILPRLNAIVDLKQKGLNDYIEGFISTLFGTCFTASSNNRELFVDMPMLPQNSNQRAPNTLPTDAASECFHAAHQDEHIPCS